MKKIILSITMLASIAFVSCSNDDDDKDDTKTCTTCELQAAGFGFSNEYCDNGDGTYDLTATVAGQSTTQTINFIDGQTIQSIISTQENLGATCK